MIAQLAYLTSPGPGRYMLNLQAAGTGETYQFEISESHLANLVIDGAAWSLRKQSCVPSTQGKAG
jgi:hypothetical protein